MVVCVLHVQVSLVLVQEKVHFAAAPRLASSAPDLTNTTSPSPHKILILGYMRSGSTLCGDILQAHPDVFYVYEPLLYLWDYYVPHKNFEGASVRRRTKQFWRQSKPYLPEPLDFLDYMFGCNLTTYNVEFLTNVLHSRDFSDVDCFNSRKHANVLVNLTHSCVDRLHQRCLVSKTIVQKVVRLSMAEADVYLQRDPYVRIIHLIRDPRGILLSRMRFNQKNSGEMHNNYTNICQRIWEDIRVSREIANKHWGAFQEIFIYEYFERLLVKKLENQQRIFKQKKNLSNNKCLSTKWGRLSGKGDVQEIPRTYESGELLMASISTRMKGISRILTIRYEDLAQNPQSLTTILYQFVGLEFLQEVKSYVRTITNSEGFRSDRSGVAKKTSRKYPFKTAYRWRLELPFSLVRTVDQTCRKVLNAMGYVSFPTEEHLGNMNIPAKLNAYGKGLMTWRMV